jgi:hypothetical protein
MRLLRHHLPIAVRSVACRTARRASRQTANPRQPRSPSRRHGWPKRSRHPSGMGLILGQTQMHSVCTMRIANASRIPFMLFLF